MVKKIINASILLQQKGYVVMNSGDYENIESRNDLIFNKYQIALEFIRRCKHFQIVKATTFEEAYNNKIEDVDGDIGYVYTEKITKGVTLIHNHKYIRVPNISGTVRITVDNFDKYEIKINKGQCYKEGL